MKITKFGHSCLLIEEGGVSLLSDPGIWNPSSSVESLDAIIITHEHADHFDLEQVKALLAAHPDAIVITHEAVAKLLADAGIKASVLKNGEATEVKGVSIESFGHEHAVVYGASPCQNTGFLVADRVFIPGDALHDVPAKPVDILALPVGGPWMKMAEAIDYLKAVKPRVSFPIHDAMFIEEYRNGFAPQRIRGFIEGTGIEFRDMPLNEAMEF